ncbi:MAG: hypothetical protein ACYTGH_06405 [Planctomycetota bacterium]
MRHCTLLVILTLAVLGVQGASAEESKPLETHLSQNAIGFWRFDLGALQDSQSGYAKLYRDAAVQEFLKKPFAFFEKETEKAKADLKAKDGKELPDLSLESISGIFEGQLCIGLEEPKTQRFDTADDLSFVFIAEIKDSAKLKTLISTLLESGKDEVEVKSKTIGEDTIYGLFPKNVSADALRIERNPLNYAITGQHLVASQRLSSLTTMLRTLREGRSDSLFKSANFQHAMRAAAPQSEMVFFLDVEKLLAALPEDEEEPLNEQPAMGMANAPPSREAILSALGLSQVRSLTSWVKFAKDGEAKQGLLVHSPGEKKGLMDLVTRRPAAMPLPAFLPKQAMVYEAARISPNDLYNTITGIVNELKPGATAMLDMPLASFKDSHGIDIKDELIGAFGEEMGLGVIEPKLDAAAAPAMPLPPQMMAISMGSKLTKTLFFTFKVKDEAKLKNALEVLTALSAQQSPMFGGMQAEALDGQEVYRMVPPEGGMTMPGMPQPAYMFAEGQLFFALDLAPLQAIITQIKDKTPPPALAQKAASKLSQKPATGIIAMNEGNYLAWYSILLKEILQMQGARMNRAQPTAEGEAPKPQIDDILDFTLWPKPEVFKQYLGYSLSRVMPREDGLLIQSVSIPNLQEGDRAID